MENATQVRQGQRQGISAGAKEGKAWNQSSVAVGMSRARYRDWAAARAGRLPRPVGGATRAGAEVGGRGLFTLIRF